MELIINLRKVLHKFPLILTGCFLIFSLDSCRYVPALIMSIPEKKIVSNWETGSYKTRIQRRRPWAGATEYQCRVKVKRLGGIYYKTVVKENLNQFIYTFCVYEFPVRKDTLTVDVCKKITLKN